MTATEAFEAKLSSSTDATVLRGKTFLAPGLTTAPAIILTLTPSASGFGARVNAMAGIFTRYRFKYLKVKFLTSSVSGPALSSISALGVLDDTNAITGDLPTTVQGVAELRCSATNLGGQTIPTQWEWMPVDKRLWYYTQSDATDTRFMNSGVLLAAASSSGLSMSIEIDFCIVFQGASDVGAQ